MCRHLPACRCVDGQRRCAHEGNLRALCECVPQLRSRVQQAQHGSLQALRRDVRALLRRLPRNGSLSAGTPPGITVNLKTPNRGEELPNR